MSFFKSPIFLFIVLLSVVNSPVAALSQEEKMNSSEKIIEVSSENVSVEVDARDLVKEIIKVGLLMYCAYEVGIILGKGFVRAHPDCIVGFVRAHPSWFNLRR